MEKNGLMQKCCSLFTGRLRVVPWHVHLHLPREDPLAAQLAGALRGGLPGGLRLRVPPDVSLRGALRVLAEVEGVALRLQVVRQ